MEAKPVTFQFSKTVKKSNVQQTALNVTEKAEEVDFVRSIDDKNIESTKKRTKQGPLVIPLKRPKAVSSDQRPKDQDVATTEETNDVGPEVGRTEEEAAAAELLRESRLSQEAGPVDDIPVDSAAGALSRGAVVGEQSTIEDYTAVPIEEFGKALLRGMGWKEGRGIGRGSGKAVAPVESIVRPKGLGLGASASAAQGKKPAEGEEALVMRPGAYVIVTLGKEKGCYGEVESLDSDGRALVKLVVSGKTLSIPEGALQLVTKKDFKRNSRVLNHEKYKEYKDKQESSHREQRKQAEDQQKRSRSRAERSSPSSSGSKEHSSSSRSASKDKTRERREDEVRKPAGTRPWVRPNLRVRCIDAAYKKGRYFKAKLVVVDVITSDTCICKSEDGRLLEDVPVSKLETVIPREGPAHVMVVRGEMRGQVGVVIERDKKRYQATLQMLPDSDVCTLDYDDVCEYAGSLEAFS